MLIEEQFDFDIEELQQTFEEMFIELQQKDISYPVCDFDGTVCWRKKCCYQFIEDQRAYVVCDRWPLFSPPEVLEVVTDEGS